MILANVIEKIKSISFSLWLQKLIAWGTMAGAVCALALLGFIGIVEFSSGLFPLTGPFLVAAFAIIFLLNFFVDGQILINNALRALKSIFDVIFETGLRLFLVVHSMLEQLSRTNREMFKTNEFLKAYAEANHYLKYLLQKHHKTKEEIALTKELEERLRMMDKMLLKYIQQPDLPAITVMERKVQELVTSQAIDPADFAKRLNKKKRWFWAGVVLASITAVFNLFATLGAWSAALDATTEIAALSFLTVIPGGVIIPLMISAAVCYGLLMLQSWQDFGIPVILSWAKALVGLANFRQSWWKATCMYLAAVITVGLVVFATLATAGTWFYLVNDGASLLKATTVIANIIRFIGVTIGALPILAFNLVNGFNATKQLAKKFVNGLGNYLSNKFDEAIEKLVNTWRTESVWQFFNPFRALCNTLDGIIFLLHLLADGLMADGGFGEAKSSTAIVGTANLVVDLPYVFDLEEGGGHQHSHLINDIVLFIPRVLGALVWELLLGTIWHYTFGALYRCLFPPDPASKEIVQPPSFHTAYSHHWHEENHQDKQPPAYTCADAWLHQEIIETCQEDLQTYKPVAEGESKPTMTTAKIQAKLSLIKEMQAYQTQEVERAEGTPEVTGKKITFARVIDEYRVGNEETLGKERFFSAGNPTRSVALLNKLEQKYAEVELIRPETVAETLSFDNSR